MLGEPDRRVELGEGLHREERLEEADKFRRVGPLHEEVGPGEAEQPAGLRFGQEHGVDPEAVGAVEDREDDRRDPVQLPEATHQVGGLVAVEDGSQHVDAVGLEAVPLLDEERVHSGGHPSGVRLQVHPGCLEIV